MFAVTREVAGKQVRLVSHSRRLARGRQVPGPLVLPESVWTVGDWLARPSLAVSGRVTVDGKPLADGMIIFHAAAGRVDGKPVAGAVVRQVIHALKAGRGPAPGSSSFASGRL